MEIVQVEGARQVTRSVDFYNLDAIISVGYRVNSRRATQFRIWATSVLKEFIKKGFIVPPVTIMLTYAEQALLRVRGRVMHLRVILDKGAAGNTCRIVKAHLLKSARKGALYRVLV